MRDIQAAHFEWASRNFPMPDEGRQILRCALGVSEEAGELAHAILKADQGIRGNQSKHDEDAKDAIGDIVLYAMHLCSLKGWDLHSIVQDTATKVLERDWQADPDSGGA